MATIQFESPEGLREALFSGEGTALRELIQSMVQEVIQIEANEHFGAGWNTKGEERPNGYRNGFKDRSMKTRVGELSLRLPQARNSSFFPSCLDRWKTSEQALMSTVVEMYLKGVSTRKVSKLVEDMCGVEVSASTVSNLIKTIEPRVEAFRRRPLGEYAYLIVDARYDKVRNGDRVESRAFLWGMGVANDGQREVLGFLDWHGESERSWSEFFNGLKKRGLHGVSLVVSDAHSGLTKAIEEAFPGACWQECQTHFTRRALDYVKDLDRKEIHEDLRLFLEASSQDRAKEAESRMQARWNNKYPSLINYVEEHKDAVLAVLNVPAEHRKRLRTSNHVERVNQELKRRGKVVRIWPNAAARDRTYGALLMELNEQWAGITWLKPAAVSV
jgi:transposase-like protein